MKYIKRYENVTNSGTLKDPYFKKDMWYVASTSNADNPEGSEETDKKILKHSRALIKLFKEYDINYKFVYYDRRSLGYGIYFMFNNEDFKKLEDYEVALPFKLNLNKVSDTFIYPDDFEDNIITSTKELKELLDIRRTMCNFNL